MSQPSSNTSDVPADILSNLQSQVTQQANEIDQLSTSLAALLQEVAELNSRFQASTNLNQQ